MNTSQAKSVIIVGGGMAGAHAASVLHGGEVAVTIVEPTGHHQFLTRLAAVAGGTAPVSDASAPLENMFDIDLIEQKAVSIGDGQVTMSDGSVAIADAVIVTAGAEPVQPPITGLTQARNLRSASDALGIRQALDDGTDHVVVMGGGPTGCQLAGAVAAAHPTIEVTLVDSGDRLMGSFASLLGKRTLQILEGRGVDVRFGFEVDSIDEQTVQSSSGDTVEGVPVWVGGFEATMSGFGPTTEGRLDIEPDGRISGYQTTFAAGDAAAHLDADGELFPMSAQIAAQAGSQVARNVQRLLGGEKTGQIDLADRGWVVDLGGGQGVAEILGVPLALPLLDRLPPLLHHAIDLRNLWQLGGVDFVRRFRPGADHPSLDLAILT